MTFPHPPSEDLPALYRAVLDGVGELEKHGHRRTAASIRRDAIAAYSAAWDDRHRQILAGLVSRVRRELERRAARSERETGRRSARPDHRHMVESAER